MGATTLCGVCQCTFCDSDCVEVSGIGTQQEPVRFEPILNDDEGNLLECGPSGMAAFMPGWLADPPACHVYSTFDQPFDFDAAAPLVYDSERYDTDSMHDKKNEPGRITFKTAGVYLVTINLMWKKPKKGGSTTGDIATFIRKNGSTFLAITSTKLPDEDVDAGQSLSVMDEFIAGDYVEAIVKHDMVRNGKDQVGTIIGDRNTPIFSAVFLRLPT